MPLGNADLTDDQAFDVAAFFNSKPRPEMQGLDRDYTVRSASTAPDAPITGVNHMTGLNTVKRLNSPEPAPAAR